MAREGHGRMAAILRGPDQLPVPQAVRIPPQANVATRLTATVAEGPLYMDQNRHTGSGLLASVADFTPMAKQAVCRQIPEVGAPCPSGLAGICAGASGNRRSYRNSRWLRALAERAGRGAPERTRRDVPTLSEPAASGASEAVEEDRPPAASGRLRTEPVCAASAEPDPDQLSLGRELAGLDRMVELRAGEGRAAAEPKNASEADVGR